MPELPPVNTSPFQKDDPVFANVQALFTDPKMTTWINSSDLLLSLLHAFKDIPLPLLEGAEGQENGYDGSKIVIASSGTDFVRLLGHELGHFYDHQLKGDSDYLDIIQGVTTFDQIIKYEMNESQATAISFIIRQQIKLATAGNPEGSTDIYLSNRIDWFGPDGNTLPDENLDGKPDAHEASIADLESRFGSRVTLGMNINDCWGLACEIASDIWGKNFLTMPRIETNRWQDRIEELNTASINAGKEIPEFLQDTQRTLKSADLGADGQYTFTFTETKDSSERTWVFNATQGSDGNDLLAGKEAGGADHLLGGGGDDILYGGWYSNDPGADILEGGDGNDTLIGGNGQDTLMGGAGNDTYYIEDHDVVSDSDHSGTIYYKGQNVSSLSFKFLYADEESEYYREMSSGKSVRYDYENGKLIGLDGLFDINNFNRGDFGINLVRTEPEPPAADRTLTGLATDDITGAIALFDINKGRYYFSGSVSGSQPDYNYFPAYGEFDMTGDAPNLRIDGGDGNDILRCLVGSDYVTGGSGNDLISGETRWPSDDPLIYALCNPWGETGRDDILLGEGGKDVIGGYFGDDLVSGGDGDDFLSGNGGNDTVGGDRGNDVVTGSSGEDQLFGGDGNDLLYGDGTVTFDWIYIEEIASFNCQLTFADEGYVTSVVFENFDVLHGVPTPGDEVLAPGDDILYGGAGCDLLDGGDGNDTLLGEADHDTLFGGEGDDSLQGGDGNDRLQGNGGDDTLDGGDGADSLNGGEGNDTLSGGVGNDTYFFNTGGGSDTISLDSGGYDTVVMEMDYDPSSLSLFEWSSNMIIRSGDGAQFIFTDWFASSQHPIELFTFNDGTQRTSTDILAEIHMRRLTIGSNGNDRLYGYEGDDTIEGKAGNDRLYGYGGDDQLDGGLGDDQLDGGDGDDQLDGGIGNDDLFGGAGDDTLTDGAGRNCLYGGLGNDLYLVAPGSSSVIISDYYNEDIDPANYQGDIDIVRFTDDTLPSDVHLTWDGCTWDGGYLTLSIGDAGNEVMLSIIAGGGFAYYRYEDFDGRSTAGIEQLEFSDGTVWKTTDLLAWLMDGTEGADDLYGTYMPNTITGHGGNDWLTGFEGDDLMDGGGGNDVLEGGIGSDTIMGGNGDDFLFGNRQGYVDGIVDDNTLIGGAGNDELYGDRGNDIMRGGAGNDTLYGGQGNDFYFFNSGDGCDIIYNGNYDLEYRVDWQNPDIIRLGEGITSADIAVSRDVDNLVLAISTTGDSLTLGGWLENGTARFSSGGGELLEFSDGTVWDMSDLADRAAGLEGPVLAGAEGDDTLVSSEYWSDEILLGKGGADLLVGGIGCDWLDGGDGDDLLYGDTEIYDSQPLSWWDGVLDDRLDGGAGDDILYGGAGRDVLLGGEGDDQLFGDATSGESPLDSANDMADTLNGGTGNDSLAGGEGDDTYVFNTGDGIDIINDHQNHDQDHISLGPGITTADLTGFIKSDYDLIVKVGTNGDQLTLTNWFGGRYGQFDVTFGDGTKLSAPEFMALTPFYSLSGSSASDYLYGGTGDDVMHGGDGNDFLYAYDGDNQLSGGAGDDILDGGAGADLLDGGAGNDTLNGGDGDDIYVFGRGYGHDTVYSFDQYCNSNSVVQLLPGVDQSEVLARYANDNSNDLVLSIAGTNDTLTVPCFFDPNYGQYWRLDGVVFGDGTVWDADHLTTLANEAASEAVLTGTDGDDVLTGSADNDILQGGMGNDLLTGGEGDDTYIFNPGDGVDRIVDGGGTDTIQFGDGITSDSLSLDLGSLLVRVGEQGDAIHVEDFNPDDPLNSSVIEAFRFADGTVLTMADLLQRGFDIRGSAGDDWLVGTAINDRITGDEGDDTLAGGKGDDVLAGGAGNDTYEFNLGDGQDIIEDVASPGQENRLTFGTGIAVSELVLEYLDGDLLIHVGAQGDAMRLKNFDRYDSNGSLVADTLQFADGSQASLFELANTAPVVTLAPQNQATLEDVAYSFTLPADTFSNMDAGDSLTYSAKLGNGDDLPGWLAFDPVTLSFSGIPANSDVGIMDVVVTAIDTAGAGAVVSFSLEIANVNDAPFVATHISGQSALENAAFSFTLPADAFVDVDAGDGLTCTASLADASALPSWLVFDAETSTFSGTPTSTSAGLWNVRVTVTDTEGASASDDFVLDVANHIVGTAAGDSLMGTVWRDVIEGLAGRDNLQGGDGDDIFLIEGTETSYDTFNGGAGFDKVLGGVGDDVIRLGDFSEDNTVEMIDGGAGFNTIAGDSYANTIDLSNTTLVNIARIESGLSGDTVIGTAATDIIIGGGGKDNLQGGEGDDLFLIEGVDDDYDTFNGGNGFDTVLGGVGNDVIRLSNFSGVNTVEMIDGGVGINMIAGTDYGNVIDLSNTTLAGIARIESGLGCDTVIGTAASDIIIGGGGQDNLQGGGGDDLFLIEGIDADYDTFTGGDGFDKVQGGDGDDVIRLSNFSGINTVEMIDGGAGANSIAGTGYGNVIDLSNTTLAGIARIESGLGCDTVIGTAASDIIIGGGGNDSLTGGDGNDTYLFTLGDGADTINNYDTTGFDTVSFGEGIDQSSVGLFRNGNNLEIGYSDLDKVSVSNFFTSAGYMVDEVDLADGSYLTGADINRIIQDMAAYAVNEGITLGSINDVRNNEQLMTLVANGWQA